MAGTCKQCHEMTTNTRAESKNGLCFSCEFSCEIARIRGAEMKRPTERPLPKGWVCECGKFNQFPLWVFAHWNEEISGKCEKCDRKELFLQGVKL